MSTAAEISPLLGPLAALQRLLERMGDRGMVIGGIAASLLGKPRLTADLDAVILLSLSQIPLLLDAAAQEGLLPRIEDADGFARKNHVMLLRHEESLINVDISLGMLPFEVEAVERSQVLEVGGLSIRLPTAEDLVIMKGVAHRARDLEDIRTICDANQDLDMGRVEHWLKQFAEALQMPEIWTDIEKLRGAG